MNIKRKAKFEWLRVLAMGMIITLHYMIKGNMIVDPGQDTTLVNLILWFITALSICAVNVYVLISGYFLVETQFKLTRVVELLAQLLEYSVIITVVMIATGQVAFSELTVYDWIGFLFPIGTEEYWFVTAYMIMYLLAPLLSSGAKTLDKQQFKKIIAVLILFVAIEKTILPMRLSTDKMGYEFGWFLLLFLIAAYIRIYGITFFENHRKRSVAVYLISAVIVWALGTVCSVMAQLSGIETFAHYADIVWDYNCIFVLCESIGLFYIFKNTDFNETCKAADIARILGGLTFGVYLLHEHPLIRYRWQSILGVSREKNAVMIFLNWIMCVIVVFAVGALTEWIRTKIHLLFFKKNEVK